MLRIDGRVVGNAPRGEEMRVSVHSEHGARRVQEETQGHCRFVVSCGCGFYQEGSDGVELYRLALQHHKDTGHGVFGHFTFAGRGLSWSKA